MEDAKGRVTIASDVLLTIIRRTVLSQPGVIALVGKPPHLTDESRHAQKAKAEGIRLIVDDNGMSIGLRLVAARGDSVKVLAAQIQQNLARSVEEITGLSVHAVNVHIDAIKDPDAAEQNEP